MTSVRTQNNNVFINELSRLVGHSHLLTDPAKTARYRKGFRSGQGEALAVVFPGTLLELWRVLAVSVEADKIILMQAANTGLTEGSTPNGNDYDRDIVIISTLRLDKLHILDKGEQVLAYRNAGRAGAGAGATEPRAALGDRIVLYRGVGRGCDLQ